jgi:hypothetical protein
MQHTAMKLSYLGPGPTKGPTGAGRSRAVFSNFFFSISRVYFFSNMTLALKETPNSTKHAKKNENYNDP